MDNLLRNLHRRFDHAALKPEVTERDIVSLCGEAVQHRFYAVAVNPIWVATASRELAGEKVKIVSVAGFPLGAAKTDTKVFEAARCVSDGAHEIDMVANIGWLKSDRLQKVEMDIAAVRKNLPYNIVLKVIVEAGKLTDQQQIDAVKTVIAGGAQFVKTSTGFFGGATEDQVRLMKKAAGDRLEIKASGGITTVEQCRRLIEAGATRLGSSSSVTIMKELAETGFADD